MGTINLSLKQNMPANHPSSVVLPSRREVILGLAGVGFSTCFTFDRGLAAQTDHALLPFDLRPASNSNRLVLAHWHYFPISIDNRAPADDYYARNYLRPEGEDGKFSYCGGYIRERPFPRARIVGADWARQDLLTDIELASRIGIDAFQYNVGSLEPTSNSWLRLIDFLEACRISGKPFRIMPCIDCTTIDAATAQVRLADALSSVVTHDCLFRDAFGKAVLAFFLPERFDKAAWSIIANQLQQRLPGLSLLFIFLSWRPAVRRPDLVSMSDYISIWSGDHVDALDRLDKVAWVVRRLGKKWVAPVWAQDFRPKNMTFVESRNSELIREAWRRIIGNGYEFVNLLTWNDYAEGSELRPSTSIGYSFYDLVAYFIQWLKAGKPPEITRDVIYYFHRTQIAGETKLFKQAQPFKTPYGPSPSNEIEAVAFLVEPCRIEIEIGGATFGFDAVAGLSAFRIPARFGRPKFRLLKQGAATISFASEFEIVGAADYQDMLYHGGSSDRT